MSESVWKREQKEVIKDAEEHGLCLLWMHKLTWIHKFRLGSDLAAAAHLHLLKGKLFFFFFYRLGFTFLILCRKCSYCKPATCRAFVSDWLCFFVCLVHQDKWPASRQTIVLDSHFQTHLCLCIETRVARFNCMLHLLCCSSAEKSHWTQKDNLGLRIVKQEA